jgi:hypothetical protein
MRSDGTNVLADADDLTEAVPNYIPSQTFRLTAEQTSNSWYALSRSPGYENRLWVNKYLYRNSGEGVSRQQNAWSEWRLDVGRIVDMAAYDETLFLVTEYAGKVWLESLPITDASPIARTLPLGLLLDSWILCPAAPKPGDPPGPVLPQVQIPPGVYDHGADSTTWTLPFAVTSKWEAWTSLYTPLGSHWLGEIKTGKVFSAQGDWSGQTVVFGKPFEFVYRMTRFKSYQTLGSGQVARNAYRTQVRKACLRFHDSEYFEAHVFAEGRPPAVYKFGPTPFNRGNRVGQEPWDYDRYQATKLEREGVFSIPIMSRGDVVQVELRSSVPRPCKFLTVEWIGLLTGKARR